MGGVEPTSRFPRVKLNKSPSLGRLDATESQRVLCPDRQGLPRRVPSLDDYTSVTFCSPREYGAFQFSSWERKRREWESDVTLISRLTEYDGIDPRVVGKGSDIAEASARYWKSSEDANDTRPKHSRGIPDAAER